MSAPEEKIELKKDEPRPKEFARVRKIPLTGVFLLSQAPPCGTRPVMKESGTRMSTTPSPVFQYHGVWLLRQWTSVLLGC